MNKSGKYVIGIGGLARSGKDTACKILLEKFSVKGISAKRIALADALKEEIRPRLIEQYGIDVLNCSPEEKEKIRPELVAFGKERRVASEGTFWTNHLEEIINREETVEDVIIVPDIRYRIFDKDECYWVQEKMAGLLLHVSRFTYDGPDECPQLFKRWVQPPNFDEAENDPKVRAAADIILEWQTARPEVLEKEYGLIFDSIVNCAHNELKRTRR